MVVVVAILNLEYSVTSFIYAVIDFNSPGDEHSDLKFYAVRQIERYLIWPLGDLYIACIFVYLGYSQALKLRRKRTVRPNELDGERATTDKLDTFAIKRILLETNNETKFSLNKETEIKTTKMITEIFESTEEAEWYAQRAAVKKQEPIGAKKAEDDDQSIDYEMDNKLKKFMEQLFQ